MKVIELLKEYWKAITGVVALVVVIAVSGGSCSSKVGTETIQAEQGITLPAGALLHPVKSSLRATRIPVVGTVMSEKTVSLSARIPAAVSNVLAVTGKKVSSGEALVILDDREIKEQLSAAEAQFKQADAEYQRTRRLMDAKATTDQAMVGAESMLKAARAQLERAKVMLTYTVISSPMDGIVTERRVEAGDMAAPGQMLVSVYDPARMRLECPVPVRLVDKLPQGKEVEVLLDRPAKTFKGRVTEIVSEVDAATRTQKVKVSLEGISGDVLPGSFGRLFIEDDSAETIYVPASSVYRIGQLEIVQAVNGKSAVRRLVKTGVSTGEQIEITAGLRNGETILVNPVKGD